MNILSKTLSLFVVAFSSSNAFCSDLNINDISNDTQRLRDCGSSKLEKDDPLFPLPPSLSDEDLNGTQGLSLNAPDAPKRKTLYIPFPPLILESL